MKKLGLYLSAAYYDIPFRIVLSLLIFKLILFTYSNGLEKVSVFPSFGAILITLSFSLVIKDNVIKFTYLFFLDSLYSLIFFSHSLYKKYFGEFASVFDLAQIHQIPSVTHQVMGMMGKEILFIVDLILLPILFFKMKKEPSLSEKNKAMIILLLLGLYCNIGSTFNGANYFRQIFDKNLFVMNLGIINYQITDIYYYLAKIMKKTEPTLDDINIVTDWDKGRKIEKNDLTGIGKGMNLIIIQVESLQNFVIGKKYHDIEITPNLNRLAKEGVYFKNIFDQTAAGNSSDSTLLANTSLYPSRKGAASFLYTNNYFDSLPKILMEHGYVTATMHAYKKSYWNSLRFEKAIGFEHQFYKDNYRMTENIGWGLSDREFFSQSIDKIRELSTPFYVFMRTLSTHGPFDAVTRDIDNFPLQGLEGELIGNYVRSMHYVDFAIGEFMKKLSKNDLLSNTVVVIYGDHRARLGDREIKRIGISDMQEDRKIPLIISFPHRKQGDERGTIGGLIDVAPTICNILGIDASDKFFMGKDLAQRGSSFVIFRDGSYVSNDGIINASSAKEQLMMSDLIMEKDMIPLIRNGVNAGN